ncbi:hypothetical protein C7Y72_00850 [Paraconexibacter algicola]|uniref:Pvc16 N-terminal domain-containing protein n=2 Tax=Paraconexibacter algicola TaxID=2133960 RepID=A0A2T4UGD5_9ACTN|nr:hypothetical protein C7Y72_00850 [Paraconexibacter algicola]
MDGRMGTIIDVPETTLIADLDRGIQALLKQQLARHGFEDADVVFETPTKDWAARLSRPTVDLFLYDLQKSQAPSSGTQAQRGPEGTVDRPPPLRVDLMFAITAWAPAVVDEHRLLSQVLAILHTFTALDLVLGEQLGSTQPFPVVASIGSGRTDRRSEFWQSVGGHYKPAIDWTVTLAIESGLRTQRGPDVRTTTIVTRSSDNRRAVATEFHALGGTVRDGDGEPVPDAWVAVPTLGKVASTDEDGRFRLPRLAPGPLEIEVRDREGRTATVETTVPGAPVDLVVSAPRRARR